MLMGTSGVASTLRSAGRRGSRYTHRPVRIIMLYYAIVFLITKYSQGYIRSLCPMLTAGPGLHVIGDKFCIIECGSFMHVDGNPLVR